MGRAESELLVRHCSLGPRMPGPRTPSQSTTTPPIESRMRARCRESACDVPQVLLTDVSQQLAANVVTWQVLLTDVSWHLRAAAVTRLRMHSVQP